MLLSINAAITSKLIEYCIGIQTEAANMSVQNIRMAQSCATEARQAVEEFHAAVVQPNMELVIFFCSSEYDLDVLVAEINRLFAGIQVVGCTTAGEIGPAGYHHHSLLDEKVHHHAAVGAFTETGESYIHTGANLPRFAVKASGDFWRDSGVLLCYIFQS